MLARHFADKYCVIAITASLIVLGARHKAPLADHTPRTKISTILRESRCPVLLVPPGL
jgi:nucleotide-binding universal stress UspA family protein